MVSPSTTLLSPTSDKGIFTAAAQGARIHLVVAENIYQATENLQRAS